MNPKAKWFHLAAIAIAIPSYVFLHKYNHPDDGIIENIIYAIAAGGTACFICHVVESRRGK